MRISTAILALGAVTGLLLVQPAASALSARTAAQDQQNLPDNVRDTRPTTGTLGKIKDYFKNTRSLKARFQQRSPDGEIVRGDLAMKRPGKARFDYDGEDSLLLVSDGDNVSLIDYEVKEVTRWPVDDTPLKLLLGDELNLKGYRAQISDEDGSTGIFYLHAQDPDSRELGTLSIRFRDQQSGGLELLGWRVVNPDGGITYVDLSAQEQNVSLDDALWTFEDPRGAAARRPRRR